MMYSYLESMSKEIEFGEGTCVNLSTLHRFFFKKRPDISDGEQNSVIDDEA